MTYLQCAAVPSFTRNVPPPMQFTSEARVNRAKKIKKICGRHSSRKPDYACPFRSAPPFIEVLTTVSLNEMGSMNGE